MNIISGGETGADRAALDFAIAHGLAHGGWCPKGRLAEDEPIPACYQLTEMPTTAYPARTEHNVVEADGTVIISLKPKPSRGSALTLQLARKYGKPVLHVHQGTVQPGLAVAAFIREHRIRTLNVAGPRASTEPGVGEFVRAVLEEMWIAIHSVRDSRTAQIARAKQF